MKVKNYRRVNECAVINTDKEALEAYKKRKEAMKNMNERINNLESKLDQILELLKGKTE